VIKVVCAVRDSASGLFGQPFFVPSTAVAVRGFSDAIAKSEDNSDLVKHPEDFALFELGSFDDETGKFVNVSDPRQLVRGKDVYNVQ